MSETRHVCGLRGFGLAHEDECSACRATAPGAPQSGGMSGVAAQPVAAPRGTEGRHDACPEGGKEMRHGYRSAVAGPDVAFCARCKRFHAHPLCVPTTDGDHA